MGELFVALPVLSIVKPNIFDGIYMFIIVSRYLRIILAANILTANEKLSGNEVSSQLYKMLIQLTILIVISALLFTGIENKTNLDEIRAACHYGQPSACLDPAFAESNEEKCATPIQLCNKLEVQRLSMECEIDDNPDCDQTMLESLLADCEICLACDIMDPDVAEVETETYISNCSLRANFIQSIYFTVITMTTVGYGDINPISDEAKMFDCLVMLATAIVIP